MSNRKVMSVAEVMEKISNGDSKGVKRFNKKNFNALMTAMANDNKFAAKVANVKKGELAGVEDIMVTKEFRKWCQHLLEKAGIDKNESVRVLSDDFEIDNMDGLYEFFTTAIYTYMDAGNQFDFMPAKDFKGSISLKNVEKKTRKADTYSLRDRSIFLGTYETTTKKHKELAVKSSCPAYLKDRKKV